MEEKNPKWGQIYKCQCSMDAIEWVSWDDEDNFVELCIWRTGTPHGTNGQISGFREKARWIWRILSGKRLYTDDIILDLETADQFVKGLSNWIEQKRKQENK